MRFSIVIPAFREEKYILRALLAIKRQTFRDFETIVVLLPSEDRTGEIARRIADKIVVRVDGGPGEARNIGASISKGEIIVFIDADTVIPPQFLEELDKLFAESEDVISVIPRFSVYDGCLRGLLLYAIMSVVLRLIKFSCGIMTAIRRDAFFQLGGFKRILGEDTELYLRMRKKFWRKKRIRCYPKLVAYTSSRRVRKMGLIRLVKSWLATNIRLFLLRRTTSWDKTNYWKVI